MHSTIEDTAISSLHPNRISRRYSISKATIYLVCVHSMFSLQGILLASHSITSCSRNHRSVTLHCIYLLCRNSSTLTINWRTEFSLFPSLQLVFFSAYWDRSAIACLWHCQSLFCSHMINFGELLHTGRILEMGIKCRENFAFPSNSSYICTI